MSEWQALGAGFAFYLILEGLAPFFSPDGFRRAMAMMSEMSDRSLRTVGGVMFCGIALLFTIK